MEAARTGYAAPMSDMQPEPESSSDGDRSWTADPQTQDPHEDRSVEAVIERTSGGAAGDAEDHPPG